MKQYAKRRATITFILTMVVCVVAVTVTVLIIRAQQHAECLKSVGYRDDSRKVWVHLIEKNPNNPDVPEFVKFLNDALPKLKCDGAHLVPDTKS